MLPAGTTYHSSYPPIQHLCLSHIGRPLVAFPILAFPTKNPRSNLTPINTASRTQLIARHFSTSTVHNSAMAQSKVSGAYNVRKIGAPNTLEHRIYIEKDGVPVSPFHDIPLYANEQQTILNMVVEIPRWTNGKLEVRSIFDPLPYISSHSLMYSLRSL